MLDYDPVANLQHWPMALSRFGQNPHGKNLYRIVFGPSRRYLVIGDWNNDGQQYAQWVPLYRKRREYPDDDATQDNIWIMERWRSPEEFCPGGPAAWPPNLGAFPDKGEYQECHRFEACQPSDANIEKLVVWVEMGRNHTLYEKTVHARGEAECEKAQTQEIVKTRIRNLLPAYGCRTFVGAHVSRGEKTRPVLKSAEELGLPTKPGMRTKPNRRRKAA